MASGPAAAGTRKERKASLLRSAVLSSCSDRPLSDLIAEISSIDDIHLFDLLILREIDILEIEQSMSAGGNPKGLLPPRRKGGVDVRTSTHVLAFKENIRPISEWIEKQLWSCQSDGADARIKGKKPQNHISALATFFPDVTSRSQQPVPLPDTYLDLKCTPRQLAIQALTNTVELAIELKRRGLIADPCRPSVPSAIVEMVCGTVLDQCHCQACETDRKNKELDYAVVATRKEKVRLLGDALKEVWTALKGGDKDWALALELEPGPTYVLRSLKSIRSVFGHLDQVDRELRQKEKVAYGPLARHVGLNVDIGHMKIAEVHARSQEELNEGYPSGLEDFEDRIVHAHISDHPGMHTRDQAVGVWNPVERLDSVDYSYLRLLAQIARDKEPRRTGLPFSGTVALELEGCSRIGWIHRSLIAMKHLTEIVEKLPP